MTLSTFDRAIRSIHYAHEIVPGSPLSQQVERAQQAFEEPIEIVYEVEGGYIAQTGSEAVFIGDDGEFALTNIYEAKRDYRKEYDTYHGKPEQKKNRAARNAARSSKGLKVGDKREVDHKVPLSKGGDNAPENLRVVSRETNRSKGDSDESASGLKYIQPTETTSKMVATGMGPRFRTAEFNQLKTWRTKAQAVKAAKAIKWPVSSPDPVHTRLSGVAWALRATYYGYLSRESYETLLASWNEDLEENISRSQLSSLESVLDKVFAAADIDVEFTKHFMDRVNDARNGKAITIEELSKLFRETWKMYRKTLEHAKPDWRAILQDVSTAINIPVVMDLNQYGELELVAKTVMRKKTFIGRDKRLRVRSESLDEGATKLNVATTPLVKARAYAEGVFEKAGKSLDELIPDFDENYATLQKVMKRAINIPRNQMPVIEPEDMAVFLKRIKAGSVDIFQPWARGKFTVPTSMTPKEGKNWVRLGFHDGKRKDDKLNARITKTAANKLVPTQGQIWLEKLVGNIVQFGMPSASSPISKATIIVSKEGYILDGHHRFGQAMLANPTLGLSTLRVPLPIRLLLKIGRAYGEAIGNRVKESEVDEFFLGVPKHLAPLKGVLWRMLSAPGAMRRAWTVDRIQKAIKDNMFVRNVPTDREIKQLLKHLGGKLKGGKFTFFNTQFDQRVSSLGATEDVGSFQTDAETVAMRHDNYETSMDAGESFDEGINDRYILKAVFMTGGAGSGKSFTANLMFGGTGLKVVNSDNQFERGMKKAGLNLKDDMSLSRVQRKSGIRDQAKNLTNKQMDVYLKERLGLILDTTGANLSKTQKTVKRLRALGYDVSMVYINTSLEVALKANAERNRTVPVKVATGDWNGVQKNVLLYRKLFGSANFTELNHGRVAEVDVIPKLLPELVRKAMPFLNAPVKNPVGKKWMKDERERRGIAQPGDGMSIAASYDDAEGMPITEVECAYVAAMTDALQVAIQRNVSEVHRVAEHFGEFEQAVKDGEFEKAELLYGVIVEALPLDAVTERDMHARLSQVRNARRGTTKTVQAGKESAGDVREKNRKRRIAARSKRKMTSSRVKRSPSRSLSIASESEHCVQDLVDEAKKVFFTKSLRGKSVNAKERRMLAGEATADEVSEALRRPLGECYQLAASWLVLPTPFNELEAEFKALRSTARLVHGYPTLQSPPFRKYGHAWIEEGGTVYDPTHVPVLKMQKEDYYALGQIDETENAYYDKKVTKAKLKVTGIWGPWKNGPADAMFSSIEDDGADSIDEDVAQTILQQLGGRRFVVMTGAKNLLNLNTKEYGRGGLAFKVGRNSKGVNYVKILLTGADLYDIEYSSVRGLKQKIKATSKGVYAEALRADFTDKTGLETSFGTMGEDLDESPADKRATILVNIEWDANAGKNGKYAVELPQNLGKLPGRKNPWPQNVWEFDTYEEAMEFVEPYERDDHFFTLVWNLSPADQVRFSQPGMMPSHNPWRNEPFGRRSSLSSTGSIQSNPNPVSAYSESLDEARISSKDPMTMTAGQINKELDRLDQASSKLTTSFIEAGRGSERFSEISRAKDPLALEMMAVTNRLSALRDEGKARYGPKLIGKLPTGRGFGPRKRNEDLDEASPAQLKGKVLRFVQAIDMAARSGNVRKEQAAHERLVAFTQEHGINFDNALSGGRKYLNKKNPIARAMSGFESFDEDTNAHGISFEERQLISMYDDEDEATRGTFEELLPAGARNVPRPVKTKIKNGVFFIIKAEGYEFISDGTTEEKLKLYRQEATTLKRAVTGFATAVLAFPKATRPNAKLLRKLMSQFQVIGVRMPDGKRVSNFDESFDEDTNAHGISFEERQLISMYDDEDEATRGTFEEWRASNFSQLDESEQRYAEIYKARGGKWYFELAPREYGGQSVADTYGPFPNRKSAQDYLFGGRFSNPGGMDLDTSGTRSVPKKSPNGSPVIKPQGVRFESIDEARKKKPSDKMRDRDNPRVFGHDLDRETLTPKRKLINLRSGKDYGADPLGNGKFKMVPSGDVVDYAERVRRLKESVDEAVQGIVLTVEQSKKDAGRYRMKISGSVGKILIAGEVRPVYMGLEVGRKISLEHARDVTTVNRVDGGVNKSDLPYGARLKVEKAVQAKLLELQAAFESVDECERIR